MGTFFDNFFGLFGMAIFEHPKPLNISFILLIYVKSTGGRVLLPPV
jgi:hypothetical protein